MRLLFTAATYFAIPLVYAQSVSLRNVSFPGTALEVGNTVQVRIEGAAPYVPVTLVQNGQPPFYFGDTDANGNWSVSAVEGPEYIGAYNQRWYVGGLEAQPVNPSSRYLPFAPRLPDFTVYDRYTGTNGPPPDPNIDTCGAPRVNTRWVWSPVAYYSFSSYGLPVVGEGAERWNRAQGKLSLTFSFIGGDIQVLDGLTDPNYYAITFSFSQGCDQYCYGYRNDCNGTCLNASAMYYVRTYLNTDTINAAAPWLETTPSEFVKALSAHEFGHGLRLGDTNWFDGRCSEVLSLMYPWPGLSFDCAVTSPTNYDSSAIDNLYPDPVPYCPVGESYCNSRTPCP